MNDKRLYGYLVVTNVCRKQIYEYKRLFAKSINLNQVDKKRWKLSFRKYNQQLYRLSFYFDNSLEGYWYVLPAKHPKLNINILANINEESEKLLKEEWFYGVKDRDGLSSLLGQVDNSFLVLLHIQRFYIKQPIFGIQYQQNKCLIMVIKERHC